MEAPVPASSLIHSATLVSAGVFLLLKFNFLVQAAGCSYVVLLLGAVSCSYGGVVAACQTDMKKLLAYSTMSHCGFLYIAVYIGNIYLVGVYLFLHGLFKAATFYCAGTFIRVFKTQDSRLMGSASRILFLETSLLLFCAINLGGMPFIIGYLYKALFMQLLVVSKLFYPIIGFIYLGLCSSVVYVLRLTYYTCFDFFKGSGISILRAVQLARVRVSSYFTFSTDVSLISVATLILIAASVALVTSYFLFEFSVDTSNVLASDSSTIFSNVYVGTLFVNYFLVFYFIYLCVAVVALYCLFRPNFLSTELYGFIITLYVFLSLVLLLLL